LWIRFHDQVEKELRPGGEMTDTRDVASKATDNAARLAVLFHLYEQGATGPISAAHMQAAARIVTWHLYEAQRFLGAIELPKALSDSAKLDAWLLKHCQEHGVASVSPREIQQYGPGPLRNKARRDDAVSELIDAGRVRLVKIDGRRDIEINPALLRGDAHGAA
jgi:putative DNA primase/helicase